MNLQIPWFPEVLMRDPVPSVFKTLLRQVASRDVGVTSPVGDMTVFGELEDKSLNTHFKESSYTF